MPDFHPQSRRGAVGSTYTGQTSTTFYPKESTVLTQGSDGQPYHVAPYNGSTFAEVFANVGKYQVAHNRRNPMRFSSNNHVDRVTISERVAPSSTSKSKRKESSPVPSTVPLSGRRNRSNPVMLFSPHEAPLSGRRNYSGPLRVQSPRSYVTNSPRGSNRGSKEPVHPYMGLYRYHNPALSPSNSPSPSPSPSPDGRYGRKRIDPKEHLRALRGQERGIPNTTLDLLNDSSVSPSPIKANVWRTGSNSSSGKVQSTRPVVTESNSNPPERKSAFQKFFFPGHMNDEEEIQLTTNYNAPDYSPDASPDTRGNNSGIDSRILTAVADRPLSTSSSLLGGVGKRSYLNSTSSTAAPLLETTQISSQGPPQSKTSVTAAGSSGSTSLNRRPKGIAFLRLHDFLFRTHLGAMLKSLKEECILEGREVEKLSRKIEGQGGSGSGGGMTGLKDSARQDVYDAYFRFCRSEDLDVFVEDLKLICRT